MGIQSQGPLQDLGAFYFFRSASRLFFSGSEALLTGCPYEAEGKILFFGRSLIRTQERTAPQRENPEIRKTWLRCLNGAGFGDSLRAAAARLPSALLHKMNYYAHVCVTV